MTDPTTDTDRPYLYFVAYVWRRGGDTGYGWRGVTISRPVVSATDVEALIGAINDARGGGHNIVPLHFQILDGPAAGGAA